MVHSVHCLHVCHGQLPSRKKRLSPKFCSLLSKRRYFPAIDSLNIPPKLRTILQRDVAEIEWFRSEERRKNIAGQSFTNIFPTLVGCLGQCTYLRVVGPETNCLMRSQMFLQSLPLGGGLTRRNPNDARLENGSRAARTTEALKKNAQGLTDTL